MDRCFEMDIRKMTLLTVSSFKNGYALVGRAYYKGSSYHKEKIALKGVNH